MRLRNIENPLELVSRVLVVDMLQEFDPKVVFDAYPDFVINWKDADNDDKEMYEINWYFAFFKATNYQLETLMHKLKPDMARKQEKPVKSSIIKPTESEINQITKS